MAEQAQAQQYLTQAELAERWRVSTACVINLRKKGVLSYFRPPGSSRVLYPVKAVVAVEAQSTKPAKEVVGDEKTTRVKTTRPEVSATNKKEWLI
jgi:hypothetical protein